MDSKVKLSCAAAFPGLTQMIKKRINSQLYKVPAYQANTAGLFDSTWTAVLVLLLSFQSLLLLNHQLDYNKYTR